MTSMIKADGSFLAFFERPIAAGLGIATVAIWLAPLWFGWRGRRAGARAVRQ
jgi:TctA family transporter